MIVARSPGASRRSAASGSLGIDLVGARAELAQGQAAIGVLVAHHDHVLESGAAIADRRDLGELVGVLADDRARLRVLEHVAALLRRVGVVDRHDGRPRRERAAVHERPFGTRRAEQGDPIAGTDPERAEPARDRPGVGAEVAEVDIDPSAVALPAERGTRVALDGREQHLAHGREWLGAVDRVRVRPQRQGGHAFRVAHTRARHIRARPSVLSVATTDPQAAAGADVRSRRVA